MEVKTLFRFGLFALAAIMLASAGVAAKSVYIPLGVANQVAEIDAGSLTVSRLFGPVENPHGLAITPDGRYLFAASMMEKTVTADQQNDRPQRVSEAEHKAHHAPNASASSAPPKSLSFITRINTRTGEIERRIDVEKFTHHVAVTPDGARVIGVQSGASRIVVIDVETSRVLRYIPVGAAPNYAVVTRDSARLFVSNAGSNSISVLDTKSWRKVAGISVGEGPEHMAFSPDEKLLYIVNVNSSELSILDTTSLKEVKRVSTGQEPHGVVFNESSQTVIVANKGSDSISVFDPKGALLQEIPLAPQPYHVAIGQDNSRVWISSRKQKSVWLLSARDFSVRDTLRIPGIGHQLVKAP